MKKGIFLPIIMAFIFAISHSSIAAEPIYVNVKKGEQAKMLELRMNNLQNQTTHISIQNLYGKIGLHMEIKNKMEYSVKLNLKEVPEGEYILLIENQNSTYYRAFSMENKDVALYGKGDIQQSVAQLSSTKKDKKNTVINGVVKKLEHSDSNINFVFIETTEGAYFQFFSIDDKGLAMENVQKMNKGKTQKNSEKLAVIGKKN